jgi:hypothetical protein
MRHILVGPLFLALSTAAALAQTDATGQRRDANAYALQGPTRAKVLAVCPVAKTLPNHALTPQQRMVCCAEQAAERGLADTARDQFIRSCHSR